MKDQLIHCLFVLKAASCSRPDFHLCAGWHEELRQADDDKYPLQSHPSFTRETGKVSKVKLRDKYCKMPVSFYKVLVATSLSASVLPHPWPWRTEEAGLDSYPAFSLNAVLKEKQWNPSEPPQLRSVCCLIPYHRVFPLGTVLLAAQDLQLKWTERHICQIFIP